MHEHCMEARDRDAYFGVDEKMKAKQAAMDAKLEAQQAAEAAQVASRIESHLN